MSVEPIRWRGDALELLNQLRLPREVVYVRCNTAHEVAEAIKSKVTRPESDVVSELVAKGDVELGMVVITQILTTPGVDLVGPLPPEIQSYIVFTAAVSAKSPNQQAARDLIKLITSPEAMPVLKAKGMEPG